MRYTHFFLYSSYGGSILKWILKIMTILGELNTFSIVFRYVFLGNFHLHIVQSCRSCLFCCLYTLACQAFSWTLFLSNCFWYLPSITEYVFFFASWKIHAHVHAHTNTCSKNLVQGAHGREKAWVDLYLNLMFFPFSKRSSLLNYL